MEFSHPYASSYPRRTVKDRDGNLKEVLTILASIELRPDEPGYDPEQEAALVKVADEFARSHGDMFDVVEFEITKSVAGSE